MLFNSFEFLLFLPIVFFLYWFACQKKIEYQNILILIASYFFYAWWDWRFLFLIILSTVVDYFLGLSLDKESSDKKRKGLMAFSLIINLGFLAYFKYFNFFIDSFIQAFNSVGVHLEDRSLNIILPVGISFYTFQTLSYSLDIYRKQMKPTKNFVAFAAYVSFFPQLVAGPIERAKDLLPQFFKNRKFSYEKAADGMRQILLGFFKKVVIADACAPLVNQIFETHLTLSGSTLVLGGILFIIQIYCDFSGYSDIAIGTARLFGFNLTKNFDVPYKSTSTTEIWRRWHITLGNWANTYVFNPLGMSQAKKYGKKGLFIALVVTFVLIGFWHGAKYTFLLFGLIHGIVLSLELAGKKRIKKIKQRIGMAAFNISGWSITMFIWWFTCIIFRSNSISESVSYFKGICSTSLFTIPTVRPLTLLLIAFSFLILERIQSSKEHTLFIPHLIKPFRWAIYFLIVLLIISFGEFTKDNFIYFQF